MKACVRIRSGSPVAAARPRGAPPSRGGGRSQEPASHFRRLLEPQSAVDRLAISGRVEEHRVDASRCRPSDRGTRDASRMALSSMTRFREHRKQIRGRRAFPVRPRLDGHGPNAPARHRLAVVLDDEPDQANRSSCAPAPNGGTRDPRRPGDPPGCPRWPPTSCADGAQAGPGRRGSRVARGCAARADADHGGSYGFPPALTLFKVNQLDEAGAAPWPSEA